MTKFGRRAQPKPAGRPGPEPEAIDVEWIDLTEGFDPAKVLTEIPFWTTGGKQEQNLEQMAAELFGYYTKPGCLDVNLNPRTIQVLAAMLLAKSNPAGIHVADLQFLLETKADIRIPSQSLYPLIEGLVLRGFVVGRPETGNRGRPRSFYTLTHDGESALALARSVARNAALGQPQGSEH